MLDIISEVCYEAQGTQLANCTTNQEGIYIKARGVDFSISRTIPMSEITQVCQIIKHSVEKESNR